MNQEDYKIAYENVMVANKMLEKEIERLKEENKKYNKWVESLNKDNHRLNNIIKEAIEYIHWRLDYGQDMHITQMRELLEIIDKLNEMKKNNV